MRFSVKIFFDSETVEIPKDYRRFFLSLIKEAFRRNSDGEEFLKNTYEGNQMKPFTFSVYMPLKQVDNNFILDGEFISFHFSTNNYEFLMRIYNGLLDISRNNENFKLFNHNFTIKNFFLQPEKRITNNKVLFRTLSPFLVRDTEDGDKYLYPNFLTIQTKDKNKKGDNWKYWKVAEKSKFQEALLKSIQSLVESDLGISDSNIKIKLQEAKVVPILHGSKNRAHSFTMTFPGIKGDVLIEAEPVILQLLYDIGIGARRGEGFGMMEVVK